MDTLPAAVPSWLSSSRNRVTGCKCRYCGSQETYRQRACGIIERYLIRAFRFVPYWCAGCDRRFYGGLHR